ncbi:lysophospholipid acyltransferase family protein [Thiohalophilus sp.]|uniref:lysophospholipid acyltransferase family protein n=1 Tax=Thiohalophilus sp. TaxID=3028392 RepID=UPI002ACEA30D|nr:GNAT family N-acyltransferase [Thiohalophilus sp.]MDZ7661345.1 GNAT family N-acyltransferase [Thiohalophilus sp.]MDZ7803086.1 GNAT family N-acyltransferase [Thiohalophilus sp.]
MAVATLNNKPCNPFSLDEVFGKHVRYRPFRLMKNTLESLFGLRELARRYADLEPTADPQAFVQQAFENLDIDYVIEAGRLENIPQTGPAIVVANHPFGALEGMLLVDLLSQRRADIKIMANGLLNRIPELAPVFLGVNPYGHKAATRQNVTAMREASRWLKQGGLLVMFPAGDVASRRWANLSISEGPWDASVARLARLCDASVVPIQFAGHNSHLFCLAGLLPPICKTLLLPRELLNKSHGTVSLRIGKPFDKKRLVGFERMPDLAGYLRMRTCLLSQSEGGINSDRSILGDDALASILPPMDAVQLEKELSTLPQEQRLDTSGELQVWYARAAQIPLLLQEIGRQREISFRSVGEGTGKSSDIDLYDRFYLHLFVWDSRQKQVVGGYRLGLVDEILRNYGRRGLYSHSLFRYSRHFLQQISPAMELGRSFVRPEYQRNFSPLMLLWKGIGHYVAKNPRYANLFGPVSISNDYSGMSQRLLIRFLKQNLFDGTLGRHVKPRYPYRTAWKDGWNTMLREDISVDELSTLIAEIEEDDKGVPVLIRQYLKLGGGCWASMWIPGSSTVSMA